MPPRLRFAWWCDKYHSLPGAGSIAEQEYREVYLNDALPRIYDAVYSWRTNGGFGLSAGEKKVIGWLVKMGAM
jgi:hypothetical protein